MTKIPADGAVPSASAADAPLGDMKMICLDRQVRGHTLQHSYTQETLWGTNNEEIQKRDDLESLIR